MADSKIYLVYGRDARKMTLQLMEAANVAARIPAGASIGLKPNLVVAHAPETGATTHAGVLEGAIEYLRDHGFEDISIMEGAWVGDSTVRGAEVCGYYDVAERYGVPFYDLKKDKTRPVDTPVGPIKVSCRALDTDYLISLPVLKGHCQTVMTCALKNNKGCLPDSEKRRFHAMGLHRPIAALAAALKPKLTIVDSICGDLNFEEGGTPVQTCRMMLGEDQVKIDAYGCQLMGIDTREVEYIGLAEKWGAGSAKIAPEDIVVLNDPASAPPYPAPKGLVAGLTRQVKQDSACSACYASLVHALYQYKEMYGKSPKASIYIGQGFRGKTMQGLGIGNCCKGATDFVPGCPPSASAVLEMLGKTK